MFLLACCDKIDIAKSGKELYELFKRKAPKMSGVDAISELEKVMIGDIEQWIYLRGENCHHPILLMLHGGPGTGQIGFMRKFQQQLEKNFVVVQWDQRGSGLSYSKNIPLESMNIDQFVHDTIKITEYILKRLNQKKLYLVAHSWGTIIGMLAISRAPQLFYRYFGISQVVHVAENETFSYTHVLEKAKRENHEKAYKELLKIGPPPWDDLKYDRVHQKYVEAFGGGITRDGKMVNKILLSLLTSKEYTLLDCFRYFKGVYFSLNSLQAEMRKVDLNEQVDRIELPIYFLMGKYDLTAPYEPTKDFFERIDAPEKQWILFENSAHTPSLEEPDKFREIIMKETNRD